MSAPFFTDFDDPFGNAFGGPLTFDSNIFNDGVGSEDGDDLFPSEAGDGGFLDTVLGGLGSLIRSGIENAPAIVQAINLIRNDEPEQPTSAQTFQAQCSRDPACQAALARSLISTGQLSLSADPCAGQTGLAAALCTLNNPQRTMGQIASSMGLNLDPEGPLLPGQSMVASPECLQALGGAENTALQRAPKSQRQAFYNQVLATCGGALTSARKTALRRLLKLTTRRKKRCVTRARRRTSTCRPRRRARSCSTPRRRARKTCGTGCPPKKKPCRKTAAQAAFARAAKRFGGRIPRGTRIR